MYTNTDIPHKSRNIGFFHREKDCLQSIPCNWAVICQLIQQIFINHIQLSGNSTVFPHQTAVNQSQIRIYHIPTILLKGCRRHKLYIQIFRTRCVIKFIQQFPLLTSIHLPFSHPYIPTTLFKNHRLHFWHWLNDLLISLLRQRFNTPDILPILPNQTLTIGIQLIAMQNACILRIYILHQNSL